MVFDMSVESFARLTDNFFMKIINIIPRELYKPLEDPEEVVLSAKYMKVNSITTE